MLEHAKLNVPFYQTLQMDLQKLPLLEKKHYQETPAELCTVDTQAAAHLLKTSGTTGAPLQVNLDWLAWYTVNFGFFNQIAELANLPNELFQGKKLAVLFVSNKPNRASFVLPLPALQDSLYARVQLPEDCHRTRAVMEKMQAPILYGKPSYLLDLRAAMIAAGCSRAPWSPALLLSSGETLYGDDSACLQEFFGAPIIDALASTEGGLIAARVPGEQGYQVLHENVHLEVLDSEGRVSTSGCGELILTNLVYQNTVFIRYRSGDYAELSTGANGQQVLSQLFGRDPASLNFGGITVPVSALAQTFERIPGLLDYQITASAGAETCLRWMHDVACGIPNQHVLAALTEKFQKTLPHVRFSCLQVEQLTAKGGKKRRYLQSN